MPNHLQGRKQIPKNAIKSLQLISINKFENNRKTLYLSIRASRITESSQTICTKSSCGLQHLDGVLNGRLRDK